LLGAHAIVTPLPSQRWLALLVSAPLWLACPQPPAEPCQLEQAELDAIEAPGHSVARLWNEQALAAIRLDLPVPTVHARNLFHLSAAMFDAWAAFDPTARGVFVKEKLSADDVEAARREAVSLAAYGVLRARYRASARGAAVVTCLDEQLERLGYVAEGTTEGDSPAALGRRIATRVLSASIDDGANERGGYADTTGWQPTNPPLRIEESGTTLVDVDHWQQLQFQESFSQNGINTGSGPQPYMGAQWREVTPFAMHRDGGAVPHDVGAAPRFTDPGTKGWLVDVLRRQASMGSDAGLDISPGALGNNALGANDGGGHAVNPVTGQPYAPQVVPVRDFGRVLAEFWADGPRSETPPGHWNVLANAVSDRPDFARRVGGAGPALDALEWDVKVYLALNGALHDAAIACWAVKRAYTSARPISWLRHLASRPPAELPLEAGLLELATADSTRPGQRHEYQPVGTVMVRAWLGEPAAPQVEEGGVGWIPLERWFPYQRRTFVTPAFPGFVSGHSTFSRAAAEVLASLTGSPFFPGGLHEFVARRGEYLQFEDGPGVEVRLQWATYFDAADQAGQSRIWGGIHLEPDDLAGRRLGARVGLDAVALARRHFDGSAP
jgi:hypothetical protein